MKIVIVGCGKVGYTLAKSLAKEKHNVILIDKEQSRIDNVLSSVDCMGLVGNGAIQSVLLEAQVDTADYFIACTNSDEINILACLMARKCSKSRTIARIRNPEYAKQIEYIMNELDLSLTINPELATAREIARIIRYSNSISSDTFLKERLNLLKVKVPDNSPIVGLKLSQIGGSIKGDVLICVIERDNEIIIPSGNSTIQSGDTILFVADHNNVITFFSSIGYEYKELKSFIIIGGGRITHYLIEVLNSNYNKCNIKVIEKDKKNCEEIAEEFPRVSVVCADGTDKNILIKEGMNDVDGFITLTGIDEENIILSLFASNGGKTKVITKINHLNFVDSLKDIELGSIVNPERIAANIIVSHVRATMNLTEGNIEALYRLCNDRVEGIGFKVKTNSNVTNIPIKDLKLKPNVIIAGILRDDKVIRPKGLDVIKVGDSVVIITKDYKFKDISDIAAE